MEWVLILFWSFNGSWVSTVIPGSFKTERECNVRYAEVINKPYLEYHNCIPINIEKTK